LKYYLNKNREYVSSLLLSNRRVVSHRAIRTGQVRIFRARVLSTAKILHTISSKHSFKPLSTVIGYA